MALNLGSVAQTGITFPVLIARQKGNSFHAKEIKGREGFFALVGNIDSPKPVTAQLSAQDGDVFEEDINGLTCTVVISEEDLEALQEAPNNAYHISCEYVVSLNDRVPAESVLFGSIWAEPTGDLNAMPAPGRVQSKDSARAAIEAGRQRRQARIRELGAKVVAEGMAEAPKATVEKA